MPSGFNPLSGFRAPPPPKKKKVTKKTAPKLTKIVRGVGNTTRAAAPTVSRSVTRTVKREVRRPVAGPPVPRNVAAQNRANAELDRINARLSADLPKQVKGKPARPQPQVAGLSPLLGAANLSSGGRSAGGFLRNLASGGLDVLTSIPGQAQLGAEVAIAGADLLRLPIYKPLADKARSDVAEAGRGVVADAKYRYSPLVQGQWGTFGRQFYDDPLPYILDVAGAKGTVGRAPSAVARATRAVAPASRAGLRASRSLSILPEAERAAYAKVTGRNILPGDGGRYRPPRVTTTTVARAEEGGPPGGVRTVRREMPAYSPDITARGRQKLVDKTRAKIVPFIERKAEARQVAAAPVGQRTAGPITRGTARVTRRFTPQGKVDRYDKRATRDLIDLSDALAEVATARSRGTGKSRIAKLKDTPPPGMPKRGISVEEAAFALHSRDMLGEVTNGVRSRGGLTAEALRDDYVAASRGRQTEQVNQARRQGKPPPRFENSRARLDVIAQIPRELLDLTDMSNPAVRRVDAAVKEARQLNANAQLRSIEAGVVRPQTVARAATRDSAIGLAGQRWGADAIRKVTVKARRKTIAIKKRIAAAQAAGNKAEVKRLKGELANHTKATKGRIAAIRRDATEVTPGLERARASRAEAETRLREASDTGSPKEISAATRSRDEYAKQVRKLERDALSFTSPRRPELVGTRGVYTPDKPIDVRPQNTGPRPGGRFGGPDQARRSEGRLKAVANIDMSPNLLLHQHSRSMQNYTGRISRAALNELLNLAAYRDPVTGKALAGSRLSMLSAADSQRVRLVHKGNLEKALAQLDELPDGKFLPEDTARALFTDKLPDGANASDYVAISKASADVWTETMTKIPYFDKGLTYFKGGLLALSPRWYVNNTFGLGLQYLVMAGPDLTSIVRGNRRGLRRAMEKRNPNAVKDTFADDVTGGDIPRPIAFGFRINGHLEETWRRGAYMNRAKKAIRDEGGRFRKMTEADMARAIENMPESMARKIVRDVEFFIGDYRKFNKLERDWLKRVVPFYSWLRVIARLTFTLPIKSPVRASAMNILSTAAEAGINPNDSWLDYYERGALQIGGKAIPTWGLNPFQTLAPLLVALGEDNPVGATAEEAVGWINPILQFGYNQAAGTNNFGQGIVAPPNTAEFGQDPESFNEVTKRPSRQRLRIPFKEAIVNSAIPGQISIIRRVAAGNRRPYDTVTTVDLVTDFFNRRQGKPRNESLYFNESKRAGRKQSSINVYTAPFGIPTYDQDDAKLVKEGEKLLDEYLKTAKKLERKRKRESR